MKIERKALATIDFSSVSTGKKLKPVHPGEVLMKDFIEPLELTRYRVAKAINVPQRRIDEICSGQRAMSADTALRLGRLPGIDPQGLDESSGPVCIVCAFNFLEPLECPPL